MKKPNGSLFGSCFKYLRASFLSVIAPGFLVTPARPPASLQIVGCIFDPLTEVTVASPS